MGLEEKLPSGFLLTTVEKGASTGPEVVDLGATFDSPAARSR
jgi:hypothetical protein